MRLAAPAWLLGLHGCWAARGRACGLLVHLHGCWRPRTCTDCRGSLRWQRGKTLRLNTPSSCLLSRRSGTRTRPLCTCCLRGRCRRSAMGWVCGLGAAGRGQPSAVDGRGVHSSADGRGVHSAVDAQGVHSAACMLVLRCPVNALRCPVTTPAPPSLSADAPRAWQQPLPDRRV